MIILFVILFRKHIHRFPPAYFRPFPWIELKNLMKVGLPSAGEQLSYSSSQVVITYFINMLGVEALATRTYCVNIIMFAYLFSISMAQGGAICIGHLIGEKKPHAAFLMGKYVMKKSVMITVMLSCILALSGHAIFGWLTSNPDIIRMGATILIIDVLLEIGRPINIFATNALRAAGDVQLPFYVVGGAVECSCRCGIPFRLPLRLGYLRHVGSLPVGREYPRLHFRPPLVWHEMGKQKFHTELIFSRKNLIFAPRTNKLWLYGCTIERNRRCRYQLPLSRHGSRGKKVDRGNPHSQGSRKGRIITQ